MSDDPHPSTIVLTDDGGMTPVLAHSMLGSVAAIRGAIDTALLNGATGPGRDGLLLLATRRLEFLALLLRDLAAGVPPDSVVLLDLTRRGAIDVVIEIGTHVDLYSAFNRTWAPGFEIAGSVAGRYRIKRRSDGSQLPGFTSPHDLRVHDPRGD